MKKVILSFFLILVLSFASFGCKSDGSSKSSSSKASVSQSSSSIETFKSTSSSSSSSFSGGTSGGQIPQGVDSRQVLNNSLDYMERTLAEVSRDVVNSNVVESIATYAVPKPEIDNYANKGEALMALKDVFKGQYMAYYLVNNIKTENGYNADYESGKVYKTLWYGYDMFLCVTQTSNGLTFRMDVDVDINGSKSGQIDEFAIEYDYENAVPKYMTYFIKNYQLDASGNGQVGVYALKMDFVSQEVNFLMTAVRVADGGEAFLGQLNEQTFYAETFKSYDDKICVYLLEKVSLNPHSNDYFVYNYGEGHHNNSPAIGQINEDFDNKFNSVYDSVKGVLTAKASLNTSEAIDVGDKAHDNMYIYSTQVIYGMVVEEGNICIYSIRDLDRMKSILSSIKTQLETDSKYTNTSGETYDKARKVINDAISYLDTLSQGTWLGSFNANGNSILEYDGENGVYKIAFTDNNSAGRVVFRVTGDTATLYENEICKTDSDNMVA